MRHHVTCFVADCHFLQQQLGLLHITRLQSKRWHSHSQPLASREHAGQQKESSCLHARYQKGWCAERVWMMHNKLFTAFKQRTEMICNTWINANFVIINKKYSHTSVRHISWYMTWKMAWHAPNVTASFWVVLPTWEGTIANLLLSNLTPHKYTIKAPRLGTFCLLRQWLLSSFLKCSFIMNNFICFIWFHLSTSAVLCFLPLWFYDYISCLAFFIIKSTWIIMLYWSSLYHYMRDFFHWYQSVLWQYSSFCVFVQPRPQSVPYREALSNRRILTSSTESREGLTQQVWRATQKLSL